GLKDAFGLGLGLDQSLALVDCQSERLLAVDVFAGSHGGQRDERVPVVDGTANNDIDVLALHDLAEVALVGGRRPFLGGGGNLVVVHITQCDDAAETGGAAEVAPTLAPTADEGDAGGVVRGGWCLRLRLGLAAAREPGRERGGRGRAEKS